MGTALFDLKSLNESLKSEMKLLRLLQNNVSKKELAINEVATLISTRAIRASILLKEYQIMFRVKHERFMKLTDFINKSHTNILNNIAGKTLVNLNTLLYDLHDSISSTINILTKYFHSKLNTSRKYNLMIRYLDDFQNCIEFCRECISAPSYKQKS